MTTDSIQIWAHTIVNNSIEESTNLTNNTYTIADVIDKIATKILQQGYTSISKDQIIEVV